MHIKSIKLVVFVYLLQFSYIFLRFYLDIKKNTCTFALAIKK